MRIAVLCNDRMAMPALQQLLQQRLLVAAGCSDRTSETTTLIAQLVRASGTPFQFFSKKDLEPTLIAWLHQHQPDVVLVKTFPWKIPEAALHFPKHGFINFHYAPLPGWRGSNPLFWMIRNGIRFGGVTVHKMDPGFDTGPVLLKEQVSVTPETTFGMLTAQLAYTGLSLTATLLNGLAAGSLKPEPQDESLAKSYGRPKPEDLFVDWKTQSRQSVRALVNACNPWNKGAGVRFRGWTFGLTSVSLSDHPVPEVTQPGTILALDETNGMLIACADGKAVRADIVYCEEGFFPGYRLAMFGLKTGDMLGF